MIQYPDPVLMDFVRGDATGLAIPAHAEALRNAGAAFLTEAFRAYGTLSPDNSVSRIMRFEPFGGGNSGHKLSLSVEYAYAYAEPGLHTELFVKFSRDFTDGFRDRRRHELEPEIRLAALSRLPEFPIRVPAVCFADNNGETGTGILITEQIAFGSGTIEPLLPKCMDHELADPLVYYRALVTALASLVGAHKSGRLSPQVDALFPFDLEAAAALLPVPWDEAQLREQVAVYAGLAARNPGLFPAHLVEPNFIARLEDEAVRFLRHDAAIRRFLHADPDFIALCHWNAHIDNAWFWRDAAGALKCGLLDWGLVRQMNVGISLWGGLSGAGLDVWDSHGDELLSHFIAELHAHGGPHLDAAELRLHLDLSVVMLGLALMMGVPALVLARLPEAVDAAGPLDPVMRNNETARTFLHVFTNFLNLWHRHDFGESLDRILGGVGGRV